MGLFSKKVSKVDDSLKELSGKQDKNKKCIRIEKKEGLENKKTKEDIVNKVNELRKKMMSHPEFQQYCEKLYDMNSKFQRMSDSNNPSTVIIDNFIYSTLVECENHYNRNNSVAIRVILDTIDDYFNDRFQSGQYYLNKDYQRIKVMQCKIAIENETKISQLDKINKRCAEFVQQYNNPNIGNASKMNLLNKINAGRDEIKLIKGFIERYEKTLRLLQKSLLNIEQSTTMHSVDHQFDFLSEMESIIEKANLNAADFAVIDKLNDKMDEASRKYASAPVFKAEVNEVNEEEMPNFIDPNEFK